MERAIWLGADGEREVVRIHKMREKGREAWAKTQNFICPDEKCGVPVIPAFPDPQKPGRKQTPRPYFRATKSAPHKPECRGQTALDSIDATTASLHRESIVGSSSAGSYPSRFFTHPKKISGGLSHPEQVPILWATSTGGYRDREGATPNRVSKMSTRLLSVLVKAYEHPPMPLESMEIHIPGCPARTYSQSFVSPTRAAEMAGMDNIYVFAGLYAGHSVYASGISIRFKEVATGNLKTSIWVANDLDEPLAYRQELKALLETADHFRGARLYCLGKFIRTHGKYAIEVESVSLVHLTFSQDDQQP